MDVELSSFEDVSLLGSMTLSYTQPAMSIGGSTDLGDQPNLVDVRVNSVFPLSLAFSSRLIMLPFQGEVTEPEKVLSLSSQRPMEKRLWKKKSMKKKGKKVVDPSTFNLHESFLSWYQVLPHLGDDNATTFDIATVHVAIQASLETTRQEAYWVMHSGLRETFNAVARGFQSSFFDKPYEHEVNVEDVFPPPV